MFKKTLIAAAIVFSGAVAAAESTGVAGGTITFNGSVSDTTCDVTTNNGSDFTVNLAPITLTDMGTTTGIVTTNNKNFTMNLKNCTAADEGTKTLKITFTSSNLSDDGNYLKNYSDNGAEGVGIEGKWYAISCSLMDTTLESARIAPLRLIRCAFT
ncbi:MAG: fimbrial protein [Kluyvera ascorbata]